MIVIYGSFEVGTDDRAAFDEWHLSCVSIAQKEKGCVAYDYLHDPLHPERGVNVEIWETREDWQAHLLDPDHVEMMARASFEWGVRDLRVHFWLEAGGHQFGVRERTDTPMEGRGDLYERIAALQEGYRSGAQPGGSATVTDRTTSGTAERHGRDEP